MIDWLLDMLKVNGPVAAAIGAVALVLNRHVNRDRDDADAVDTRLRALESDRVTRHDLERVLDRIDQISGQISDNQTTLLDVLTRK